MLALAAVTANGGTIYVCRDGSGDYLTIQEGIDAASPGDEVVVCDGTYTGPLNKNLDFAGKAIIVRSENGPANCIIDCENDGRGFYFHSAETAASVVDGFTIHSGWASQNSPGGAYGGGVLCENSSDPTITNCIISGNSATDGGGVYVRYSSPTISNCTISGNSTGQYGDGGGVYCYESSATISNCTIGDNRADDDGGGLHCRYGSVTITNCTISGNSARWTGGGVWCWFGTPMITDCTIRGNTAWQAGGVYYRECEGLIADCTISGNWAVLGGAVCCRQSDSMIIDCTISGNSAAMSAGGVLLALSSPTISNCTISRNSATYNGGGILCESSSNPTITNCTISGNSATDGAGAHCDRSSPALTNCTITHNTATGHAGALYCANDSDPTLVNSILWDNPPEEIYVESGSPAVSYSDVQGGWPGTGNIDQDPLFIDPSSADYHLQPASPGIDAANNQAVPPDELDLDADGDTSEPIPIDLDERLRFADRSDTPDTGDPDPSFPDLEIVDMGAYEYQCTGDLNGDGVIDRADLEALLTNYATPGGAVYESGDLDLDGEVDLSDLAALLAVYGTICE